MVLRPGSRSRERCRRGPRDGMTPRGLGKFLVIDSGLELRKTGCGGSNTVVINYHPFSESTSRQYLRFKMDRRQHCQPQLTSDEWKNADFLHQFMVDSRFELSGQV